MFRMSKVAGAFAGIAVLAVACGGASADRAGGVGNVDPTVLTMAQGNHEPPDQLVSWAEEVSTRSGGTLEIEFANLWREGETDAEVGTIADVRGGDVDLAWVGARAFDRVGMVSFQPLLAPLLVDSHDLQRSVFDAGIPAEMMAGLDDVDLAGIGVLPGPMRKVLGVTHPFLTPADFAGQVVGIGTSDLAAQTMQALGATPQDLPTGADLAGLDGMDQQLDSILGNRYSAEANFVSVNVNLWPRPLVIFMNRDAFEALTADQQAALRDAAAAAVDHALADSRAEDADAIPLLCDQGMTLAVASDDDLSSLRAALEPVYAQIAADPANRGWLDEIDALKQQLGAPPDSGSCPAAETDAAETDAFPQGTFEVTITAEDYEAKGWEFGGPTGTFRFVIDDATVTVLDPPNHEAGFVGQYTVFRDRIEVSDGSDTVTANWSFDGENITFTDVTPAQSPFEVIWESRPFQVVELAAEPSGADADSLAGTYTWTLTAADAVAAGSTDDTSWLPCSWIVRLGGGEWEMDESCTSDTYGGTYDVARDHIEFTWDDGFVLGFTFAVDGNGTITLTPDDGTPLGDAIVWSTKPWTRSD